MQGLLKRVLMASQLRARLARRVPALNRHAGITPGQLGDKDAFDAGCEFFGQRLIHDLQLHWPTQAQLELVCPFVSVRQPGWIYVVAIMRRLKRDDDAHALRFADCPQSANHRTSCVPLGQHHECRRKGSTVMGRWIEDEIHDAGTLVVGKPACMQRRALAKTVSAGGA